MTIHRPGKNALRFMVASALAATLLAGCGGDGKIASASRGDVAQAKRSDEKAMKRAEAAVLKAPKDAALRASLGQLYLQAGRFTSATTAFNDAMELGENSPRTALGLVLSQIAQGKSREAVAILDDWRDSIPASDLGLALALAGESSRGAAILFDALRGGDNTPKVRQNLAYAYALDGRWREARTMMTVDVPAEEVDLRLSEWVANAKPENFQQRVATLLGAPVRSDPGLPQQLALDIPPAAEQVAVQQSAQAPVVELPAAEQSVALSPSGAPEPTVMVTQPAATSFELTPAAAPAAPVELSAPVQAEAPAPADVQAAFAEFTGPVAQPLPAAPAVRVKAAPARPVVRAAARPAANGNHAVQLGSFSSAQGARRAWGIFAARTPSLKNYRMVITPVVVRGRNFWRVAAAGFDNASARGLCSSVKNRGGVCFAYATTPVRVNPTAPTRSAAGPAFARRR